QVVGEDEHAAIVGVRGRDPATARCERVVFGHRALVVRDGLADPGARTAVRGVEHPLAAEGMPAELPGHGVVASTVTERSSQSFAETVTVIVPGPVGRTTANARPL